VTDLSFTHVRSDDDCPAPASGTLQLRELRGGGVPREPCKAPLVRDLVLVSGAPGAGKSTLAVPLARALSFPLLSKDVIKETLFDHLGHLDADELVSSRKLGAASMELLWRLAHQCPRVLLEANFRSHSAYERDQLRRLSDRPIEVYCRAPIEVAAERYAERGASSGHHAVHVARSLPAEAFAEYQQPVALGPVIEIDTTTQVDISAVAVEVTRLLARTRA
jgi:predicted kinase